MVAGRCQERVSVCFGVRDTIGWVLRDEQGVIGHVGAVARAMDMEVGGGDLGLGASRASLDRWGTRCVGHLIMMVVRGKLGARCDP